MDLNVVSHRFIAIYTTVGVRSAVNGLTGV